MKPIMAECSACDATGIYSGMAEAKYEGVICLRCQGTGCERISYQPFTARRRRRGIRTVRRSQGIDFLANVGRVGPTMHYAEWWRETSPSTAKVSRK